MLSWASTLKMLLFVALFPDAQQSYQPGCALVNIIKKHGRRPCFLIMKLPYLPAIWCERTGPEGAEVARKGDEVEGVNDGVSGEVGSGGVAGVALDHAERAG